MVLSDAYLARLQKIADYAVTKIGCGYIYGATGWVCSPARREQQAAQYPAYASTILGKLGARWDGTQCFDCAQLTRLAVAAAGGYLPSGATSQWKGDYWLDKGTIDTMPDIPGIMLYRWSNNAMQHTGVYKGDGEMVDARGTAAGVIRAEMSTYPWTHWALPRIDENEGGEEPVRTEANATVVTQQGNLNLRETPGADGVRVLGIPKGARIHIYRTEAVNGEEWGLTEYPNGNGVWFDGWVSMAFVRFDEDETPADPTPPADANRLLQIRNMAAEIVRLADLEMGVV